VRRGLLLSFLSPQKFLEGLAMRREEEPVLVAADRVLRRDDVEQARDRDVDFIQIENPPLGPDRVELEARHDEGEIDFQIGTGRTSQSALFNHTVCEPAIAWLVEWLVPAPQFEAGGFTPGPALDEVFRIRR